MHQSTIPFSTMDTAPNQLSTCSHQVRRPGRGEKRVLQCRKPPSLQYTKGGTDPSLNTVGNSVLKDDPTKPTPPRKDIQ